MGSNCIKQQPALAHVAEDGHTHALYDHLEGTAKLAAQFAKEFNCAGWGYLAGYWHYLWRHFEEMLK
jgi:hypothetical protein